jgi:hypothetical protein
MSNTEIVPRKLRLARPAARSDIADELLAKAEAVIDRLSAEYPAHASRDLERLEAAAASMTGGREARAPQCNEIARVAHDMRGQGAVFGYPLMTRLAGSLCLAMRSLEPQDDAMTIIVRNHIAGMRALLDHGVTGAENRPALTIAASLELMVYARAGR